MIATAVTDNMLITMKTLTSLTLMVLTIPVHLRQSNADLFYLTTLRSGLLLAWLKQ